MDNKKQPLFVIICGGSGSGKTTFTNLVLKNINNKFTSQLISLDNFYIPVPDEKLPGYNFDSPNALNWDMIVNAINDLMNGDSTKIPNYDFTTHNYTSYNTVNPTDLIVIEGIFSLQNEMLKKLANLTVYLDVPDDERFIRRLSRDIKERNKPAQENIDQWRNTVIQAHYLYVDPFKKQVDMIFPWTKISETAIDACAGAITKLLEKNIK